MSPLKSFLVGSGLLVGAVALAVLGVLDLRLFDATRWAACSFAAAIALFGLAVSVIDPDRDGDEVAQ